MRHPIIVKAHIKGIAMITYLHPSDKAIPKSGNISSMIDWSAYLQIKTLVLGKLLPLG